MMVAAAAAKTPTKQKSRRNRVRGYAAVSYKCNTCDRRLGETAFAVVNGTRSKACRECSSDPFKTPPLPDAEKVILVSDAGFASYIGGVLTEIMKVGRGEKLRSKGVLKLVIPSYVSAGFEYREHEGAFPLAIEVTKRRRNS